MLLKNGKIVSNNKKPYIVAELNSSHNGKVEIARKMIDAAKESGCDAVKFQSWSAESLYCKEYYDQNPISKRMVSQFALSCDELLELSKYCSDIGIDFASTPYSKEEVDFLVEECHVPFIKVASMDINNLLYLRYIAKKNVPVVLSTGMSTEDEIETAVREISNAGNHEICILHCVSLYPVDAQFVNLNNMVMLREKFPEYAVGYSDHTIGSEAACAAVALGAALIEKHFTLDNKRVGWDNQMATEPADMKLMVERCQRVHLSLGGYERKLSKQEYEQRKKMRRSLVAAKDMCAGHVIQEEDLDAKRPEDGISLDQYDKVIGKMINRDVPKDTMLVNEYFMNREKDFI